MVPVQKEAEVHDGFQGIAPKADTELMPLYAQASPQPITQDQQALVDEVLTLDPVFLAKITAHVQPLPVGASQADQDAKMEELYQVIKVDGALGIEYQLSEGRKPKKPNEVLTPGSDGVMRADCDELSMLFIAAAKELNIDISDMRSITFRFNSTKRTKGMSEAGSEKKDEIVHIVVAIERQNESYIIDPALSLMKKIDSNVIDDATAEEVYAGVTEDYLSPDHTVTITGLAEPMNKATNAAETVLFHFKETALYYKKTNPTAALANYEKWLKIKPDDVVALQGKVFSLFNAGMYNQAEQEFPKLHKVKSKDIEVLNLGMEIYIKTVNYEKISDIATEILAIDDADGLSYNNKIYAELELGRREYRAGNKVNAKKHFIEAQNAYDQAIGSQQNPGKLPNTSPYYGQVKKYYNEIQAELSKV